MTNDRRERRTRKFFAEPAHAPFLVRDIEEDEKKDRNNSGEDHRAGAQFHTE